MRKMLQLALQYFYAAVWFVTCMYSRISTEIEAVMYWPMTRVKFSYLSYAKQQS